MSATANPPPFHPGETQVQLRAGVQEVAARVGKMMRPFMLEQHRTFFASLPYIIAAARDVRGRPWATVLSGQPGFIDSPDDHTLAISSCPAPDDPLAKSFDLRFSKSLPTE